MIWGQAPEHPIKIGSNLPIHNACGYIAKVIPNTNTAL